MRIVRFTSHDADDVRSGIVEGDVVHEVQGEPPHLGDRTERVHALSDVRLCAPIRPRTIVGIGANFVADGADLPQAPKLPILFLKPESSVIGPDEAIVLPPGVSKVKFESELAVVIGAPARNVGPESALDHVFGYTVANDIAALDFFHPDGHWTVGKSFDTFCPLGPCIVTDLDLATVEVEAEVNGKRMQRARLDRMITGVREMIAFVSTFMTLQPGDVLLTGTPDGAGFVGAGDAVECVIAPIGRLRNVVRAG